MKWKKRELCPAIISHDCVQAQITFDRLLVLRADHSLWMLHPFTSGMWLEFRKKRGRSLTFVPPKFQKILDGVRQIDASAMTIAAVRTDDSLWVWNHCGSKVPGFVKMADGIRTAQTTENGLLALDQNEQVWFWKRDMQQYSNPAEKIMDDTVDISAGVGFYAAIRKDASLWTWGRNDCGQLGIGNCKARYKPEKVMDDIIQVSLGARHGAAIDRNNNLWTWGENAFGQLGRGNNKNSLRPVRIRKNVQKVSLGYSHTGILTDDKELWLAGFNGKFGSLGDGKTVNRESPVLIEKNIKDIALGADRGLCVDTEGKMSVWG